MRHWFFKQISIIVEYNCDASEPTTIAIIVFIIRIGVELNTNLIAIRIDMHNSITGNCNWYLIDLMTPGIFVYDIFNVMAFVMNIMNKILTLSSLLHALYFIFNGMISLSDKRIAIECFFGNNNDETVVMNKFYEIGDAEIVVTAFLTVIYFVMQVIDGLSLNILLSIEFDASIIAFDQLIIYSTSCLVTSAINIYFHPQVTHNVSYVFLFFSLLFFYCLGVINVVVIQYEKKYTHTKTNILRKI